MVNAIDFRNNTNAILVGEPIGERPNSYSENDEMTLPNSRLVVSYSTRYYKFVDEDVHDMGGVPGRTRSGHGVDPAAAVAPNTPWSSLPRACARRCAAADMRPSGSTTQKREERNLVWLVEFAV
jgi:hypothetical protein